MGKKLVQLDRNSQELLEEIDFFTGDEEKNIIRKALKLYRDSVIGIATITRTIEITERNVPIYFQ